MLSRLAGVAVLTIIPLVAAAAPDTLVHSGRLLDTFGEPVNNTVSTRFDLYDGTTSIWDQTMDVVFQDGYYSAVLGTGAQELPAAALLDTLEVQVTVGGDVLTRQELHASPLAMSVNGAVRLSTTAGTCDSNNIGGMQLSGTQFQFCDGTTWRTVAVDPASSIATTDIADWDQAHGWGDHGSEGYLTTDTFAALTCAYGQQPVRNGDSNSWICGYPNDYVNLYGPGWVTSPTLVTAAGPLGVSQQVHRATSPDFDASGCYQWGISPKFKVDPFRAYEFSIWIKSADTDMNNYLGFYLYDAAGVKIGGSWGNPYFRSAEGDPNSWVRWSGILAPADFPASGAFMSPERSSTNGRDFVMADNTTTALLRFGGCYSSTINGQSWFANPEVREIDRTLLVSLP